jgi:hypothetical protein
VAAKCIFYTTQYFYYHTNQELPLIMKKLSLKKVTLSTLDNETMNTVKGGLRMTRRCLETEICDTLNCPTNDCTAGCVTNDCTVGCPTNACTVDCLTVQNCYSLQLGRCLEP